MAAKAGPSYTRMISAHEMRIVETQYIIIGAVDGTGDSDYHKRKHPVRLPCMNVLARRTTTTGGT